MRRIRTRLFFASLAATAGLGTTACSGGGGGAMPAAAPAVSNATIAPSAATAAPSATSVPATPTGGSAPAGGPGTASVSIAVAGSASTSAARRRLSYVSAATASYELKTTSAAGAITTTNGPCPASGCTITTAAPLGADTFLLTLVDARGYTLSSGSAAAAIAAGTNDVAITLGGLAESITTTLDSDVFTTGTPSKTNLHVHAYDADGDEILGGDPFTLPVALAIAGSGFSLAASSITSPAAESIALAYDGSASSATLSASNGLVAAPPLPLSAFAPEPLETSVPESAFVDSIGVNTHFADEQSVYATSYGSVKSLLLQTGICHIRDGMPPSADATYDGRLGDLAQSGVRSDVITSVSIPPATAAAFPASVPGAVEALESPNEYDESGDTNWPSTLASYVRGLSSAIASSSTASVPLVGPALVSNADYERLGDLSAVLTDGNMHDYFGSHQPENTGYGSGGYGSIAYSLAGASATSGSRPVVATETGYGTNAEQQNDVDESTQGKYLPRVFFAQYLAGVPRTYAYELVDEGASPFSNYGLLRPDLSPKPAFTALSNLVGLLADPGTAAAGGLRYAFSGSTASLEHLLLRRSDGTYAVAFWLGASDFTGGSGGVGGTDTAVPPQSVTVTFGQPVTALELTTFDASGNAQRSAPSASGATVSLSATDTLSILQLTAP